MINDIKVLIDRAYEKGYKYARLDNLDKVEEAYNNGYKTGYDDAQKEIVKEIKLYLKELDERDKEEDCINCANQGSKECIICNDENDRFKEKT